MDRSIWQQVSGKILNPFLHQKKARLRTLNRASTMTHSYCNNCYLAHLVLCKTAGLIRIQCQVSDSLNPPWLTDACCISVKSASALSCQTSAEQTLWIQFLLTHCFKLKVWKALECGVWESHYITYPSQWCCGTVAGHSCLITCFYILQVLTAMMS